MRHRIANPLAVICGVAQTLRDRDDLESTQREELMDSLLEQAMGLQAVVLEPRATTPTEFVLEPWPRVDVPSGPDRSDRSDG